MQKLLLGRLVIVLLLISLGVASAGYFLTAQRLTQAQGELRTSAHKQELAKFNMMLMERVIVSKEQMTFDERFELENAVRKLGEIDVLRAWRGFVDSKNDMDAQIEIKSLLKVLAAKMAE